jgi:Uma2 family endonuclease
VTGEKFTGALDLIIEVTSPGAENRRRDFTAKRKLYGKYGIQEYWIVDAENQEVVVYRKYDHTLRETAKLKDDDEIASPLLPDFRAIVAEVFRL